jgi:protein TonB
MIISSPTAKLIALAIATVTLIGGMRLATPDITIEIEGGSQTSEAKLGSTFEDMSAGTLAPEPVEDAALKPTPPDAIEADQPTEKTQSEVVQNTPQVAPAKTQPVQQAQLTQATPALITPILALPPDTLTPVSPVALPVSPNVPAALQQTLAPTLVQQPSETMALLQTPPTQTITAKAPDSTAPPLSVRPQRRDPEKAAKVAAERPKPKVTKAKTAKPKTVKKKTSTQRGNANQNNTKGASNGSNQKAKAKSQSAGKNARSQSGNAAASNYPGKVTSRINRVQKPRVNSRGTAVVSFSISANGGLSRISIARSSGSAALDKAALRHIRKAAPFPKPPHGARRQFSIRIKGR